jgi:hypothetical protein
MNTTLTVPRREIRPPGFGDFSVGQELLRVAQQDGQKQLSVLLAQWEMIVTFFKHGLEIPLCINQGDASLKEQHRVILAGAIAIGEVASVQSKGANLNEIGYNGDFVSANLRYLHDTYRQWYVERDSESVKATYRKICDASPITATANP